MNTAQVSPKKDMEVDPVLASATIRACSLDRWQNGVAEPLGGNAGSTVTR